MNVSNLTGKRLKNIKDSALSHHLLQCKYTFDCDCEIFSIDASKCNLLGKESLLIEHDNPVLNRATEVIPFIITRLVLLSFFPSFYQILLLYPGDCNYCSYCITILD